MKILNHRIGIIKNRYKRFLADVELDGKIITVHVPNTGSMKSCWDKDWKVAISKSDNEKRKYAYTLELTNNGKTWINANTSRTNYIAAEGIELGIIKELSGYKTLKREVPYKDSRIDILLTDGDQPDCLVEVKNVTLKEREDSSLATFPDSVSVRGAKHLNTLISWVKEGKRAAMLYIVGREDVDSFAPAKDIDPNYAKELKRAMKEGVEVVVYQTKTTPEEIIASRSLPLKKW